MDTSDVRAGCLLLFRFLDGKQRFLNRGDGFRHRRREERGDAFLNEGVGDLQDRFRIPVHRVAPAGPVDMLIEETGSKVNAFWQGKRVFRGLEREDGTLVEGDASLPNPIGEDDVDVSK